MIYPEDFLHVREMRRSTKPSGRFFTYFETRRLWITAWCCRLLRLGFAATPKEIASGEILASKNIEQHLEMAADQGKCGLGPPRFPFNCHTSLVQYEHG